MKCLFLHLLLLSSLGAVAQKHCGSSQVSNTIIQRFPELKGRYGNSARITSMAPPGGQEEIIIPVIVNIVYRTPEENLPDAVVREQIRTLNADFAATNEDLKLVPPPFKKQLSGDCGIRFILKGITRTATTRPYFLTDLSYSGVEENDPIKFTHLGGRNGTEMSTHLNIWTGNILSADPAYNPLGGYAPRPGGLTAYDGVVISHLSFGPSPDPASRYNKGRTLTHEVGHWLNLIHLWGENGICGSDEVADTPPQESANQFEPHFPKVSYSCKNGPDGDMFMNYMDYVFDDCMFMFTRLQKERMRATYANTSSLVAPPHLTLMQSPGNAIAKWKQLPEREYYMVLLKEVKKEKWDTSYTVKNGIKATGLTPGVLYEIKVITLQKGKTSEGAPYLFVADKHFFEMDKTPQMIEIF